MSEIQQEIRVHHYKRVDGRSGDKELVTEIVVENSDTGRFLKKMEETRLTRPCFQTLDMRGKVLGECRRYVFNDRVHFLDDISYAMFQKGLEENHGLYTVGTFEAIIFGAHTIQAMREAQEAEARAKRESQERRQQRYEQDDRNEAGPEGRLAQTTITFYNPEVVPFGYFRQRQEGRLQYATGVQLIGKAGAVRATTRDISIGGVQVIVKGPCPFSDGQEVQAHFVGLEAQAGGAEIKGVRYSIAALTRRESETILGLRRLDRDAPASFTRLISSLVERYQRKYKLDVEDDYISANTLYYERAYTENLTHIPFFVSQRKEQLVLSAVALTKGNQPMMQFFSGGADGYDFRCLQLPARLEAMRSEGTMLLALYRDKVDDEHFHIHSAADCEFESVADFSRMLRYAMGFQEHMVVRVQVENGLAQRLDERKTDYFLERLSYKSAEDALGLRNRLKELLFTGTLVDVTQQVREGLQLQGLMEQPADPQGLSCWVGGRCIEPGTAARAGDVLDGVKAAELVRFGYVECRREDRYLVETAVNMVSGKQEISGTTRDISTRGMSVRLAASSQLEVGQELRIGLVNLQKKKSGTNLMDIPYRVVKTDDRQQLVMLERIIGRSQEGLSKFFVELIAKNQQKLSIDAGDIWNATASRIYEGLVAMNMGSLPFFIGLNEVGVTVVQRVAVPRTSNRLAQFFQAPDGEYEFYPVGDPRLILALRDAITSIRRQSGGEAGRAPQCELEMYCYKEQDEENDDWVLRWSSELELGSDAAREAYIRKAMEHEEYRFMKIVATFTQDMPAKAFDKLLEPVMTQSRHRGLKLSEQLRSVMGYGELIDITADIVRARQ